MVVAMNCALIIAPYFTNGGYPPLGAAYVNAALRDSGLSVSVFDLQYALRRDSPHVYKLLRSTINVAREVDCVPFVLDPRFLLYSLYDHRFPRFDWEITARHSRWDRLKFLLLNRLLRKWAGQYATSILEANPRVVLFSTYVSNLLFSLLVAQRIRSQDPGIGVVFGGPGCASSEVQEFVLRLGPVDVIALGDTDTAIGDLARSVASRNSVAATPCGYAILRNGRCHCVRSQKPTDEEAALLPSFDGFPVPRSSLCDYQGNWNAEFRSRTFTRFLLPIDCSRGCNRRCVFCSELGLGRRRNQRSPERVVQVLEKLITIWGVKNISFNDSLLNHDEAWHDEFLERLRGTGLNINWWAYYRPDKALREQTIRQMATAGCRMVGLGVESFHQETLYGMRRRIQAEDCLRILRALSANRITAHFALLTGFPGQNAEDVRNELETNRRGLESLRLGVGEKPLFLIKAGSLVRVEPHSYLFRNPETYRISIRIDPIRMPVELAHLHEPVRRLSLRWEDEMPFSEKRRLAAELRQAVRRLLPGCLT